MVIDHQEVVTVHKRGSSDLLNLSSNKSHSFQRLRDSTDLKVLARIVKYTLIALKIKSSDKKVFLQT